MALDVKVSIELTKPIGNIGTWFPLLYVVDSGATSDAYGEYKDLASVKTAGYAETSDAYKAAALIFMQDNAPEKIGILKQSAFSTDTMKNYLVKGWRQLVLVGTHTNISTIAEYIETTDKMLFVTVDDKGDISTTEQQKTTKTYSLDRTFIVYYTGKDSDEKGINAAAAVVGATAGLEAGSFTYKNIPIKGVKALELSDAEITGLHDLGAISIVEKAGDIVTTEGIVSSGEYADVIDSKDYIVKNISYNTQKVFNNNKKVPYTNVGIGMLEAATLEALVDGYNHGMIAETDDGKPDYSVSFALRSQTSESDRAARKYPYGQFSFSLAGAIHYAEIKGTISV